MSKMKTLKCSVASKMNGNFGMHVANNVYGSLVATLCQGDGEKTVLYSLKLWISVAT